MADALSLISPTRVSVRYKNAVGVNYYRHCPSSHLPHDATVVLIEVTPNIYGGNVANALVALKRVLPNAAVAFVLWPSQAQFLGWQTNAEIAQIRQAAQLHGAQIIELPAIMSHVEQMLPKQGRLRERLWANRGQDVIHPSPQGHLLIGAVVARCVWRSVFSAMCSAQPDEPVRRLPAVDRYRWEC